MSRLKPSKREENITAVISHNTLSDNDDVELNTNWQIAS